MVAALGGAALLFLELQYSFMALACKFCLRRISLNLPDARERKLLVAS
jgi:hypothetical protein